MRDTALSRIRRLRTYYKTDFQRRNVSDSPGLAVVESLDLLGMHQWGQEVPLILDEHNVYWELLRYEITNAPFFRTWFGRRNLVRSLLIPRLLKRAKAFEVAALRRATRVLTTSEQDRARLLEEVPDLEGRIFVLPNCIDLELIPYSPDSVERNRVVFLANYNYIPNREAAVFVSRNLAPSYPDTEFLLVGPNPPSEIAEEDNVATTGYVRDLGEVLREAAVCLAPLTQGSGTRLKVLTYLGAGKAVVATSKACEGLEVQDGVHLLVRDDPDHFRSALGELLEDPAWRRSLGTKGRELVEKRYDWRVHVNRMKAFTEEVLEAWATEGG